MTNNKNFSIVFMGTPQFAVTILDKLHIEDFDIKAVVTATDKPAGRGRKIQESDVKKYAVENGLPLLQPSNLKDESFQNELQQLNADLFVVVAFRMLPKSIWSIPKKGTINLHGSLLPQYRGAAPINWAVINGEKKTGVTTFFINEKIDTGDLLLQKEMEIGENETAGEIHDRMMHLGADTVLETVKMIQSDKINAIPQKTEGIALNPASKIFKNDCLLNFDMSIKDLHNFIRGMSPFPTAWFHIKKKDQDQPKIFKVYRAQIQNNHPNDGVRIEKNDNELHLKTKNGVLNLLTIQLEGKKRMDAKQFLTGFNPNEWDVVSN
ncbi:MAG: methionyl-tRNA formyltransferase [Fluviicola sp.]|nr:MAG: methionyl-tRNA formyltransferase [Fluviicola sp.]